MNHSTFESMASKKQCTNCKNWLQATPEFFQKDKHTSDGLTRWCKSCRASGRSKRYWSDPVRGRNENGPAYKRRAKLAAILSAGGTR